LKKSIHISKALLVIYFMILLVFGKEFSKYRLAGPLYAHDLFLLLILAVAILSRRFIRPAFPALQLLIGIGILYLLFSLVSRVRGGPGLELVLRQFAIILYLLIAWMLWSLIIHRPTDLLQAIDLIKAVAIASMILQVGFLAFKYITDPGFSLLRPADYNYLSPLIVFGIICFSAYSLAYIRDWLLNSALVALAFFLAVSTGHSSAFLAVAIVVMLYFFLRFRPAHRMSAIFIGFLIIASFLLLPQFTDPNASWRLLFWKHILHRSLTEGYLIFGHGFGAQYMTHDYAVYINELMHSNIMLDEYFPRASYLNPPHNSILSLVFHLGLVPALLFFLPMKIYFRELLFVKKRPDANGQFLILAFTGCLVWICFNVILELPHSALFFWLVYFTCMTYLNQMRSFERTEN